MKPVGDDTTGEEKNKEKNKDAALLSFWQYWEDANDFTCINTEEISQPIPFKDVNYYSGKIN